MRTYVRADSGRREHPPRGPRRVLRVGRATRRPPVARAAGDRRRWRRARCELRGQGVRDPHGDGRERGAAAVPARDRGQGADGGVLRGEQGGVRRVPRHDAARRGDLDRRGVPRRARAAADLGHAGGDRREAAAAGARGGRACRSPSGSRRRSTWRRSRARWQSPTGCSSCRWARSSRSCTRCRSSGCGASGRSPRTSSTATGCARWGRSRSSASRCSSGSSGARPAATCTRSRTTATRGASTSVAGAARSARNARLGAGEDRWTELETILVGLVDRLARRLRKARRVCRTVTLRLRFDDFTRASRSHTLPEATARTEAVLETARALLATARPLIEAPGHHAHGHHVRQPVRRRRRPARAAGRRRAGARPRRDDRRRARALRVGGDHTRRAARARPGHVGAAAAGLCRRLDASPAGAAPRRAAPPSAHAAFFAA